MTFFVRRCIQIFLVIESILFILLYCFGPKGLSSLHDIAKSYRKTELEIVQLTEEVEALQKQAADNKTDFAKEKIAREQLLMKKNNEIVYFKKL